MKKNNPLQKTLENIVLAFGENEKRHPKRMPFCVVDNYIQLFGFASDGELSAIVASFNSAVGDVHEVHFTIFNCADDCIVIAAVSCRDFAEAFHWMHGFHCCSEQSGFVSNGEDFFPVSINLIEVVTFNWLESSKDFLVAASPCEAESFELSSTFGDVSASSDPVDG